jgi:hypothetical protein
MKPESTEPIRIELDLGALFLNEGLTIWQQLFINQILRIGEASWDKAGRGSVVPCSTTRFLHRVVIMSVADQR